MEVFQNLKGESGFIIKKNEDYYQDKLKLKDMEHINYKDLLPYVKIKRKELKRKIKMVNDIMDIYNEKNNKLRWDLVPWNTIKEVVKVITKGADKYGIDNWKTVPSNIFEAAMMRHFISYKEGEHIDLEWNLPHLAHLACNAIFLLWKELLILNIEEEKGELKSTEALKNLKDGVVK